MSADSTSGSQHLPPLVECLPGTKQAFARSLGGNHGFNTIAMIVAAAHAAKKGHGFQLHASAPLVTPNVYAMLCAPPALGKSRSKKDTWAPITQLEEESEAAQEELKRMLDAKITRCRWTLWDLDRLGKETKSDRRRLAKHRSRVQAQIHQHKRRASWGGRSISTDVTPAGIRNELWQSPDEYASLILPDGRHLAEQLLLPASNSCRSALLQILLSGFSTDDMQFSRASGITRMDLDDPRLSVMIALQPDLGLKLIGSPAYAASGLSSRFLAFFFEKLDEPHRSPEAVMADMWTKALRSIASPKRPAIERLLWRPDSTAEENIQQCFTDFAELALESNPIPLKAKFWERAGEQLERLTLILGMMSWSEGESTMIGNDAVEGAKLVLAHAWQHLEQAIETTNRPTEPLEDVARLRQAIRDAGGEFPVDPKRRGPAMLDFSKAKVEKIAALAPSEFTIRRTKPKGGEKRKPGGPRKVVAFAEQ